MSNKYHFFRMTTDISMVRWDPSQQQDLIDDYEYDGGNSSSRLFERSRIKALAGNFEIYFVMDKCHSGDVKLGSIFNKVNTLKSEIDSVPKKLDSDYISPFS